MLITLRGFFAFESHRELRCRDSMVLCLQDVLPMLNHVYAERLAFVHLQVQYSTLQYKKSSAATAKRNRPGTRTAKNPRQNGNP